MRPIPARKVISVLKEHGFVPVRQKGSHVVFTNAETGISVPVPLHGRSKPIHIGTLKAIIKQSGIPPCRFS